MPGINPANAGFIQNLNRALENGPQKVHQGQESGPDAIAPKKVSPQGKLPDGFLAELQGKIGVLPKADAQHMKAEDNVAKAKTEASNQEEVAPLKSKKTNWLKQAGIAVLNFMKNVLTQAGKGVDYLLNFPSTLMKSSNETIPSPEVDLQTRASNFKDVCDAIKEKIDAHDVSGLFRIEGNEATVKEIKAALNSDSFDIGKYKSDLNNLSSVLKREMRTATPLDIDSMKQLTEIRSNEKLSSDQKIALSKEIVQSKIAELPESKQEIYKNLMGVIGHAYASVEVINDSALNHQSVVISTGASSYNYGPEQAMEALQNVADFNATFEFLVKNYESVIG